MPRSGLHLVLARLGFLALLLLALPITALAVVFTPPFEPWRRSKAEQLLSEAIDMQTVIKGPVTIGFGWEPTISIADVASVDDDMPTDLKGVSAKALSLRLGLLPLLAGKSKLSDLVVSGLKVDIEIPVQDDENAEDDTDVAGFLRDFVRSRFADDISLRNAQLNYINLKTGFTIRYAFDDIGSKPGSGGGVLVSGVGHINGKPWKVDGKIDPPGADPDQRNFVSLRYASRPDQHSCRKLHMRSFRRSIDAILTGNAPALTKLLDVYDVKTDFDGSGTVSARFSGELRTPKMSEIALKVVFRMGTPYNLPAASPTL